MKEIAGKTAFVTGAGNGIGRAIARALAAEAVAVAVADIDEAAAGQVAAEIEASGSRAVAVRCDVTDRASLEAARDETIRALGPIHILCNNAGVSAAAPFDITTPGDWRWMFEVNVMGVVNGLQVFLPHLRGHGQGAHIVNTASMAGLIPVGRMSAYGASKHAVVGLTECLEVELEGSGVGLSLLCPGIVNTELAASSRALRPEDARGVDPDSDRMLEEGGRSGSDPAQVGDCVVEAIRSDSFYVISHPKLLRPFANRAARIQAADGV